MYFEYLYQVINRFTGPSIKSLQTRHSQSVSLVSSKYWYRISLHRLWIGLLSWRVNDLINFSYFYNFELKVRTVIQKKKKKVVPQRIFVGLSGREFYSGSPFYGD